jgi:dimeric dUTPase (all-alpha-NTP-PPase superfamily)
MFEQLKIMLELQDKMNSRVTSNWVNENHEWYRAIWLECGELVDHYGYKWWKHQDSDMDQVKLEVVDIWHFGLSMQFDGRSIDQIAMDMIEEIKYQELDILSVLDATEVLAEKILITRQFKLQYFWQLMFSVDLNFDQLYQMYIGKNVLNFFRQDNGYKEGSYKKVWEGKEDNEHLIDIQSEISVEETNYSQLLYEQLQERYKQCS